MDKSKTRNGIFAYLLVFGVSILSALAISSLVTTFPSMDGRDLGLAPLIPYFMITIAQMVLAWFASLSIILIFTWLSKKNSLFYVHEIFRCSIPLFFNGIAALSLTIWLTGSARIQTWQMQQANDRLYENLTFTFGDEKITPNEPLTNRLAGYRYYFILHVENNTGLTFENPQFILGSFDTKVNQRNIMRLDYNPNNNIYGYTVSGGKSETSLIIPTGKSDIVVDMNVKCGGAAEPLYVLYKLGNGYKYIPVSHEINDYLDKIKCRSIH